MKMETKFVITELLENKTKEQLIDDFYVAYSEKLKFQERVKELEEKLEMNLNLNNNLLDKINFLTKDDNLNIKILKSELDIDYEQLEIMFKFLPLNRYFESHFHLVFHYYPTDAQIEKHKDLRDKLYKILVNNYL